MTTTLNINQLSNKKSSIVELFNSLTGPEKTISLEKPNQTNNISLAPVFLKQKTFPKRFLVESFINVFQDSEEILKSNIDILESRKNFDSLEKWTNNLEQTKSTLIFM